MSMDDPGLLAVDTLGDLLPVSTEESYIGRGMRRRWRYVTGWTEEVAK